MTEQAAFQSLPRLYRSADWVIRVILALAFVSAGSMKLVGVAQFVTLFDQIGLGQWFRLLTGGLEVIGGLLVLVPRTSMIGAALLACVMLGATITHLAVIGGSALPALVLLALAATTLWLRRAQVNMPRASLSY